MRNFSYSLQKIRYGTEVNKRLREDSYIGIYMRCGGLNARRFTGKGVSIEQWLDIFSYYMELWISQLVLDSLISILPDLNLNDFDEELLTLNIISLFDKNAVLDSYNLVNVKKYINTLQKKSIDELDLEILVSPGSLIFGLPKLIQSSTAYFTDFQFLYLIDEFENLEEYHQRYINTLIRERESPATFRIGVRLYGIKTPETYSAGEEIKEGSEYEIFDIDEFLRNNSNYEQYMDEICRKKLMISGYLNKYPEMRYYFEELSVKALNDILVGKKVLTHFIKLRNKLSHKYRVEIINEIIRILSFPDDYVIERANVMLFYRGIKGKLGENQALRSASLIAVDALRYHSLVDDKRTLHFGLLEKYRTDIIDQLCRENNIHLPYYGFSNFVKMSAGIPRVLLKILKETFKQALFNGEKPFQEGKISLRSQAKGLEVSAEWYIDQASPPNGKFVKRAFDILGNFLREIRFSDLPPECSICIFSINSAYLSEKTLSIIKNLRDYSYIIDVSQRREKAGNAISHTFQIIGIAASHWELAINRRGVISLSQQEVKFIFENEHVLNEDVTSKRLKRYNYPFQYDINTLPLFEDDTF